MEYGQQNMIFSLAQDYLEKILEEFQDGIYITDSEANTIYLNHSYELISGLPKSEMIGKNMKSLVESGVISMSGTLSVLETGKSIALEQTFRTGKRAMIRSAPVFDENREGRINMVVTVVREITEIHALRLELRRLEQSHRACVLELQQLRKEKEGSPAFLAQDEKTETILRQAETAARLGNPVFLTGETGTGKYTLANYMHTCSERADRPFLHLELSAVAEEERFSWLFGAESDDRDGGRIGILESVSGGTVYIDEITELPAAAVGPVLALMRGGGVRMGDGSFQRPDLRFIAGSRYSPETLRQNKMLPEALLAEISGFVLELPPLRKRRDDIMPLAEYFLNRYNRKTGEKKRIDRNCCFRLMQYDWEGNVTELRNAVRQAAVISGEDELTEEDFGFLFREGQTDAGNGDLPARVDLKYETARLEASYMERMYARHGNVRDAAKALEMDASTFVRKRQRYQQMGLMEKSGDPQA